MNLANLFEFKNFLDALPGVDYTIEDNFIFVYIGTGDDSCSEFVFEFKSFEDFPF